MPSLSFLSAAMTSERAFVFAGLVIASSSTVARPDIGVLVVAVDTDDVVDAVDEGEGESLEDISSDENLLSSSSLWPASEQKVMYRSTILV